MREISEKEDFGDDELAWDVFKDTNKSHHQPILQCHFTYDQLETEQKNEKNEGPQLVTDQKASFSRLYSEEDIVLTPTKVTPDNARNVFIEEYDILESEEIRFQRSTSVNIVGHDKEDSQLMRRQVSVSTDEAKRGEQQSTDNEASTLCIRMVDEVPVTVKTVYGLEFSSGTDQFDESSMADVATKYCLSLLRCQFYGQTGPVSFNAGTS